MKKPIFLALIALFLFFISSCDKKEEVILLNSNLPQSELKDLETTMQELDILTKSYTQNYPYYDKNIDVNKINKIPKWLKIVAWDVGGGMAGFYYFGLVGAVIGGAASSIAHAEIDNPFPLLPQDPSYAYAAANTNNPYDNIGYNHYYSINQALSDTTNYLDANGNYSNSNFYNFSSNLLLQNGVINSTQLSSYTSTNNNLLESYVQEDIVNSLYNANKISSDTRNIMTNYFNALYSTTHAAAFENYSIQAENLIVNSTMNSLDKEAILSTMATARYGVHYWQE